MGDVSVLRLHVARDADVVLHRRTSGPCSSRQYRWNSSAKRVESSNAERKLDHSVGRCPFISAFAAAFSTRSERPCESSGPTGRRGQCRTGGPTFGDGDAPPPTLNTRP